MERFLFQNLKLKFRRVNNLAVSVVDLILEVEPLLTVGICFRER
jgi:hypothetical protein